MATTTALTENSCQGINSKIPACIGPEAWLNRSSRPGCGHAYDETSVGLVVYVRNDPVNLIDPDGREWRLVGETAGIQGGHKNVGFYWMWFDEDLTLGPAELTPVMTIHWDFEADGSGNGDIINTITESPGGGSGLPGRVASTVVCRGCLGPWMNPDHPGRDAVRDVSIQDALLIAAVARPAVSAARGIVDGIANVIGRSAAPELSPSVLNSINHIFNNPEHNLDVLVSMFRGDVQAYNALVNATTQTVTGLGLGEGAIYEAVAVRVGGFDVFVSGKIVDGVVRIGTAYIKP